jgi:hypothetical protein
VRGVPQGNNYSTKPPLTGGGLTFAQSKISMLQASEAPREAATKRLAARFRDRLEVYEDYATLDAAGGPQGLPI